MHVTNVHANCAGFFAAAEAEHGGEGSAAAPAGGGALARTQPPQDGLLQHRGALQMPNYTPPPCACEVPKFHPCAAVLSMALVDGVHQ